MPPDQNAITSPPADFEGSSEVKQESFENTQDLQPTEPTLENTTDLGML